MSGVATLETRLYKHAMGMPNRLVSQADITTAFPNERLDEITDAINKLNRKSLFTVKDMGKAGIKFLAVSKADAKKHASLDEDEGMVFRVIEAAGNEGIWTKFIKTQTNLHQTIITKVLKSLESRNEVKSVKSVKYPTRKLYMLYNLTPSVELTGGPWFTDNELDTEFIKQLLHAVLGFVRSKSFPPQLPGALYPVNHTATYVTAAEITRWVKNASISSVELDVNHVRTLLDVLQADGEIEAIPSSSGGQMRTEGAKFIGVSGGGGKKRARAVMDSDSEDDRAKEERKMKKRRKERELKKERERKKLEAKKRKRRKEKERERERAKRKKRKSKGGSSDDESGTDKESPSGSSSGSGSESESESSDGGKKSKSKPKSKSSKSKSSSSSKSKKRSSKSKSKGGSSDDSDSGSDGTSAEDPDSGSDSDSSSDDGGSSKKKKSSSSSKKKGSTSSSTSSKKKKRRLSDSDLDTSSDSDSSSGTDSDTDDSSSAKKKGRRPLKRVEVSVADDEDDRRSKSGSVSRSGVDSDSDGGREILDFGDDEAGALVYRAVKPEKVSLGWTEAPCGRCPMFTFCKEGGPVQPSNCEYLDDWLNQSYGA